MKTITTIEEFRALNIALSLGFVPTMGALHSAHMSLVERSIKENDQTVVSIFVNPTQFNDPKDLAVYPRPLQDDINKCEKAGVDYVFIPDVNSMYFEDETLLETPNFLGNILEGACRPGHFNGVIRVVLKLFNIVKADRVYLGRKDAQQLAVISKMVNDLFIDIEIVSCDLVRESDGLAMSSRNVLLSSAERNTALALYQSLFNAKELINSGKNDIDEIKNVMENTLSKTTKLEYVAILSRDFKEIEEVVINNTIILVAAFVGKTRLIDNMLV